MIKKNTCQGQEIKHEYLVENGQSDVKTSKQIGAISLEIYGDDKEYKFPFFFQKKNGGIEEKGWEYGKQLDI